MQKLLDELLLIVGVNVSHIGYMESMKFSLGGPLGCHLSKQVQEEAHVLLVGYMSTY